SREDRDALVAGLVDGTIEVVATDHAPHSAEEKSRGLEKSAMGIVGIEGGLEVGNRADFTVLDLDTEYEIDPETFLSKGKATPFAGWRVVGRARMTVAGGKVASKEQ
ncbi:MAG: dihydroorotase, partial [Alistipes sp.]|nr:dihydroorotase [Alistipes sp.]